MKLLLFFIFCASAACASAQVVQTIPKSSQELLDKFSIALQGANPNDSMVKAMKLYLESRNLRSGTIRLSQDNMPCVIPNMKLATPMPNAWKGDSLNKRTPGKIPNPARPVQPHIIPIKQSVPAGKKN